MSSGLINARLVQCKNGTDYTDCACPLFRSYIKFLELHFASRLLIRYRTEMSYLFLMLARITHTQGKRTQHPTTILEILKAFNRDLSLGGGEGGVTPAVIYTRVIQ